MQSQKYDKKELADVMDQIRNLIHQSSPDRVARKPFRYWVRLLEQQYQEVLYNLPSQVYRELERGFDESIYQLCSCNNAEGVQKGIERLLVYWAQNEREGSSSSSDDLIVKNYYESSSLISYESLTPYEEIKITSTGSSKIYKLSPSSGQISISGLSYCRNAKLFSSSSSASPLQIYIIEMIEQLQNPIQDCTFTGVRTLIYGKDKLICAEFDKLTFYKKDCFSKSYNNLVLQLSKSLSDMELQNALIKTLKEWLEDADLRFPTQLQICIDILIQLLDKLAPEESADLSFENLKQLLPTIKRAIFDELNENQAKLFSEGFNSIVSRAGFFDIDVAKGTIIKALKQWSLPKDSSGEALKHILGAILEKVNEANEIDDLEFGKIIGLLESGTTDLIPTAGVAFKILAEGYELLYQEARKPRYPLKSLMLIISELEKILPVADSVFVESKAKPKKVKPVVIQLKDVFYNICQYDAVHDILTGKLQRLDPVIQEAGCQWRVPFVLDLHEIIVTEFKNIPLAEFWLNEFISVRSKCFNTLEWLKTFDCVRSLQSAVNKAKPPKPKKNETAKPWLFKVTEEEWEKFIMANKALINRTDGPTDEIGYWESRGEEIDQLCTAYQSESVNEILRTIDLLKEEATGFIFMIDLLKKRLQRWDLKVDPVKKFFNSMDYLTLCKGFTVNRVRRMDCFGLSGVRNDLKLPFGGAEAQLTINLAKYSRKYMRYIAQCVVDYDKDAFSKSGKPISLVNLDLISTSKVGTFQNSSAFTTHVFYGPLRTIFTYQSVKKQPILIDIRRLNCTTTSELLYTKKKTGKKYNKATFTLNGAALLYFEPDENGVFRYIDKPSVEQRKKVGMYVECFSIYRADKASQARDEHALVCPEKFEDYVKAITTSDSIINWIMCGASQHDEFPYPLCWKANPKEKRIRLERKNEIDVEKADKLIEELYIEMHGGVPVNDVPVGSLLHNPCQLLGVTTDTTHLWRERIMFQNMITQFGIESVAYKDYSDDRSTGYRNDEPVVFAPIHIYGSTYEHKIREIELLLQMHGSSDIVTGRLMDPKDEHDLDV